MVRASSGFVGFLSTSLPCQMATGVSDGFAPNLSSKASAEGSSSSSIQTWSSRLRAANSLRRVASLEWREPIILRPKPARIPHRSEEHTSELQSRKYLVCRLLLEKKKQLSSLLCARPPDLLGQHRLHRGRGHTPLSRLIVIPSRDVFRADSAQYLTAAAVVYTSSR